MTTESFKLNLGKTGETMANDQIEKLMCSFDHLINYWLDRQETEIFGTPIKYLLEQ